MQTVSSEIMRNQEQKFRKMCKVKLDVQQIKSGKENFLFHEIGKQNFVTTKITIPY